MVEEKAAPGKRRSIRKRKTGSPIRFFRYVVGKRENINYHVIANIIKLMAIAVENRELLHQDALAENIMLLQQQLCDYIL